MHQITRFAVLCGVNLFVATALEVGRLLAVLNGLRTSVGVRRTEGVPPTGPGVPSEMTRPFWHRAGARGFRSTTSADTHLWAEGHTGATRSIRSRVGIEHQTDLRVP